jgi:hypothetical protein
MNPIHIDKVQAAILEIRGQKVLLDHDVAKIYGVQTKRINEAVRNNPDKFPDDYILLLTKAEWAALKSKFSTSKRGGKVKLATAFPEAGKIIGAIFGVTASCSSSSHGATRRCVTNRPSSVWRGTILRPLRSVPYQQFPVAYSGRVRQS